MTMLAANTNSRLGASEAHLGASSLDFDGRPTDWSAVAFGDDAGAAPTLRDWAWIYAIVAFAGSPWLAVAALALWAY